MSETTETAPKKAKKAKEDKVLFSKKFGAGTFSGNTLTNQREIVKELATQLLAEGAWTVDTTTDKKGIVTQFIVAK
jgi:hypothetical protein